MIATDGMRQIAAKLGGGSWRHDYEQRQKRRAAEQHQADLDARLRQMERQLRDMEDK
jgi:hypothetical protein